MAGHDANVSKLSEENKTDERKISLYDYLKLAVYITHINLNSFFYNV